VQRLGHFRKSRKPFIASIFVWIRMGRVDRDFLHAYKGPSECVLKKHLFLLSPITPLLSLSPEGMSLCKMRPRHLRSYLSLIFSPGKAGD